MKSCIPQTFSVAEINFETDLDFILNNKNCSHNDAKKLKLLFSLVGYPFMMFYESVYVDKVYRDSYYSFFSNKHLDKDRNCSRISIFNKKFDPDILNDFSEETEKVLNKTFVGTIVLRPLANAFVGRTLIDPFKLNIPKSYIRTTRFSFIIYGHELFINAFPFSSQDGQTMTCAETSVWSILEYYGSRYPEYKTVLPSTIIKKVEESSYERNLPSRGLSYQAITSLIKNFGFSPRLYAREAYKQGENDREVKDFKRIFHYYIESGIPVAVGICRSNKSNDMIENHSIVAIGHSKERKKIDIEKIGGLSVLNTADYYDEYVIMDDNSIPYHVEKYDKFSIFSNGIMKYFAVPLYKRIFLEAKDAESIFYTLLCDAGIKSLLLSVVNNSEKNPILLRIYLTSSRKYKKIRGRNSTSNEENAFYQQLIYPKFLWIAELSTIEEYENNKVFGEIVLDATATRYNPLDSIIFMRFLNTYSYRLPDESIDMLKEFNLFKDASTKSFYKMYKNNLCEEER